MLPLSTCRGVGGVVEYAACCDTLTLDRLPPVTSTDPLPASMTTVVTRLSIVKDVAAG